MPSSISTPASQAVQCYPSKTFDALTFRGIDGTETTFGARTEYVPGNVQDLLIGMAVITEIPGDISTSTNVFSFDPTYDLRC